MNPESGTSSDTNRRIVVPKSYTRRKEREGEEKSNTDGRERTKGAYRKPLSGEEGRGRRKGNGLTTEGMMRIHVDMFQGHVNSSRIAYHPLKAAHERSRMGE